MTPSRRVAGVVASVTWTLVLVMVVAALVVLLRPVAFAAPNRPEWWELLLGVAVTFSYSTVGALLAARRPDNVIGWLLLAVGLFLALFLVIASSIDPLLLVSPGTLVRAGPLLLIVAYFGFAAGLALAGPILMSVFPDGRLPSPRWRVVPWAAAFAVGLASFASAFRPAIPGYPGTPNTFGVAGAGPITDAMVSVSNVLLQGSFVGGVAALVVRARRADRVVRQQLKWFGYVSALIVVSFLLSFLLQVASSLVGFGLPTEIGTVGFSIGVVGLTLLPVAIGIAVTRYRLYEIDRLISRTLVYVPLTAILAGLYAASIALFQRLFVLLTGDRSDAAIVITTLILAGAFTPIRKALEGIVESRFKPGPATAPQETGALSTGAQPAPSDPAWVQQVEQIAERVVARVLSERASAGGETPAPPHP